MNNKNLELYDSGTGEYIGKGNLSLSPNYNRLKRLNMKIWAEGLSFARKKICKGINDVVILDEIIRSLNTKNVFERNITHMATFLGVSRQAITALIKRAVEINLMKKISRGQYEFNPFVVKGRSCPSKYMELLQKEWSDEHTEPTQKSLQEHGLF